MLSLRQHIKETIRLAWPVSVAQLGWVAMSIVDTIMVGKIGPDPIAAAALGSGFFNVVYVLGLGVSLGATPLVAIAVGARNTKSARAIFEQSFLLNMTCAVGMTLLVYFGADVMWYLNQPPAVVELAVGSTSLGRSGSITTR